MPAVIAAILLVVALLAFVIGLGLGQQLEARGDEKLVRFATRSHFSYNVIDPFLYATRSSFLYGENLAGNFLSGLTTPHALPRLVIDIAHEDYEKLARKRDEAIRLGVLVTGNDDYVPASVTLDNVSARTRVRLKGDLPDHYRTHKWSMRIRVRGDNTLSGMKLFSIQQPGTRNFIGEWVAFKALEREDIVVPRYRFVDVTVNGTRKGVYALEEHFEKRMLEYRRRREGPIVKFNEDLMWHELMRLGSGGVEYGSFMSSAIDGYAADLSAGTEFERAAGLLDAFRTGRLPTTTVFDGRRLAMFVALREVFGAPTIRWQNLRFYYNPVTSKLEPIGFDNEVFPNAEPLDLLFCWDGGISDKRWPEIKNDNLLELVFADDAFWPYYTRALERVSRDGYFDDLFDEIDDELYKTLRVMQREYPWASWSRDFIEHNQRFIRESLAAEGAVRALFAPPTTEGHAVLVANLESLPIEVLGLSRGDAIVRPHDRDNVLMPTGESGGEPPRYVRFNFPAIEEARVERTGMKLLYRVLGLDDSRSVSVQLDGGAARDSR